MRLANCFRAIGLSGRQWSVLLLVAAFASAAFTTEAAKEKRGRKRKQALEPMDNETGSNNMEIVTNMCHKVALRRCGQNFMKIFNLVDYLDGMDHYNAQCTLRKAFFACLEKVRQKPCRRRRQLTPIDEKKFTDKLSEAIWATRVCVLGIQRVDEIPTGRQAVPRAQRSVSSEQKSE